MKGLYFQFNTRCQVYWVTWHSNYRVYPMSQPPHSSWTSLAHIRLISDLFPSCLTPNLRPCLKVTVSHILSSNWFTQCMWSPDAILSASYYVKWVSIVFAFSGLDKCLMGRFMCVFPLCSLASGSLPMCAGICVSLRLVSFLHVFIYIFICGAMVIACHQ